MNNNSIFILMKYVLFQEIFFPNFRKYNLKFLPIVKTGKNISLRLNFTFHMTKNRKNFKFYEKVKNALLEAFQIKTRKSHQWIH